MRGCICPLQFLLVLASTISLASMSPGTHDHILLSQIWYSPSLEGQVPVFTYIPPALGSLFMPLTTRRVAVEILVFDPASTQDYFPLIWHAPHIQSSGSNNSSTVACEFLATGTYLPGCCRGNMFTEPLPSREMGGTQTNHYQYYTNHTERDASNNFSSFSILFAPGKCLPSRCLATIGYIHRHIDRWEGFYEVRQWEGFKWRDVYTTFNKDWFKHSKAEGCEGTKTQKEIAYTYFRKVI
jgi:hypothetical protein